MKKSYYKMSEKDSKECQDKLEDLLATVHHWQEILHQWRDDLAVKEIKNLISIKSKKAH